MDEFGIEGKPWYQAGERRCHEPTPGRSRGCHQIQKKVKRPKRYKVILLNDDYTSMEFVVFILENIFHKSVQQAFSLMMSIHNTGSGIGGVYSREIAEMKINKTIELARKNEFPLQCVMEED